MSFLAQISDFIINLSTHIDVLISTYGTLIYVILFLIIFAETGLVVTPFLPGDSLIFTAAAAAGNGSLNIFILIGVFVSAAILGDTLNYWIGRTVGEKIIHKHPRLIDPKHIKRANEFFEKYGGKAIVLARFLPIVRTMAPFVAGIARMHYTTFMKFNVIGALLWVLFTAPAGYFLGTIPLVQDNFSIVILLIAFVSLLPPVLEWYRTRHQTTVDRTQV